MTLIAGRYRLERRLGLGGMSTVHLAMDERLEREVAVKVLAEHLADDPTFVSRFQREALAAARLVHPNIVQVFDSGFDPESGRHYIVMEYVPGQSVAEILRDRGHLDVGETVPIVTQACRGLDYAHRNGVVHRDVKPGNLLRAPDGTVKLADFGIAKAAEQSSITQVGSVLGTAAYLAPEQATGEEAGPQSDLYALGVVTYQILSGRLPYEAASLSELVLMQQREPPTPLHELDAGIPPTISRAVEIALAIDRRDRYPDASTMAEAIDGAARGQDPAAFMGGSTSEWDTAATSVLSRTEATRAVPRQEPVRQREPVPARRRPAMPPAAPVAAAGSAPQQRRRSLWRSIILLLIALLVAAAVVIAIVASNASHGVQLNNVDYPHVDQSVDAMKQLVDNNRK